MIKPKSKQKYIQQKLSKLKSYGLAHKLVQLVPDIENYLLKKYPGFAFLDSFDVPKEYRWWRKDKLPDIYCYWNNTIWLFDLFDSDNLSDVTVTESEFQHIRSNLKTIKLSNGLEYHLTLGKQDDPEWSSAPNKKRVVRYYLGLELI